MLLLTQIPRETFQTFFSPLLNSKIHSDAPAIVASLKRLDVAELALSGGTIDNPAMLFI